MSAAFGQSSNAYVGFSALTTQVSVTFDLGKSHTLGSPSVIESAMKFATLRTYSRVFRDQTPQRYRVRDSHEGPEVGDIQWHTCYGKTHDGRLINNACTLIVAANVRTGEVKYFFSNSVPGRGGWTIRDLLQITFGRWKVEASH